MATYRTSMQIVGDLLDVTEQHGDQGIKTGSLITKTNLSHTRLSHFIENLTSAGLMTKTEYDGKNIFIITQKGKQYLDSYKRFAKIAESFGLEI